MSDLGFAGLPERLHATTRYASSAIPAGGGHPGHLEGGAEMMWRLNADLNQALKELRCEIDKLRAYRCRNCGTPGTIEMENP